jgi:DNA-binding NtrC family response regulator
MPKPIILFADNDNDFRRTRAEFLEQEGYLVIQAANPTEARQRLEDGGIDLAILDIRLENDDERDISGLRLAKETAEKIPTIVATGFMEELVPTILLTGFPSYEAVREALAPKVGGLPAAVDFLAKQEGSAALLAAVRRTLSAYKGEQTEILVPKAGTKETPFERMGQADKIRAQKRVWAAIGTLASLLFGAGMGIGAVLTGDPRLLWGTVLFAILMFVGIVVGVLME